MAFPYCETAENGKDNEPKYERAKTVNSPKSNYAPPDGNHPTIFIFN